MTNSTGVLTVASVDEIIIRDDWNGEGNEVLDESFYLGNGTSDHPYVAAAYNDTHGYLGDVDVTWTSSDPDVADIMEYPSPGSYLYLFSVGQCYLIADYGGGVTDTTGIITVWTYDIDYIVILDGIYYRKEVGDWVGDKLYHVGAEDTYYAAGFNNTAGFVSKVSANWTCSDTTVGTVTSSGYQTSFNAVGEGTCTVTAEYNGMTNITGELTVVPIDEIIIRDAPKGGGNPVLDVSYYIGKNVSFWAAGYNDVHGYMGDVEVLWSSNDTYVGTVTSPGSVTYFKGLHEGTCFVTADYGGGVEDTTGTITVYSPYTYTVDDDGPADFSTIQEAIDAANPGDEIFVYAGTYLEHLTIGKEIKLVGQDRNMVILDGEGAENVIYISGEDVSITEFTIQNGEYGVYCDETESTTITYSIIKDYIIGIYNNKTKGGYVAHNDITDGEQGIVTFEAFNDAIRWNTISYNTVYGAKDYNSQLKNCFNWNHFHHNYIAYYYDPNVNLTVLEFDGNLIENNHIGIMVAEADTVSITQNEIYDNVYGMYLINASPYIGNNVISRADYGIYTEGSQPTIENNYMSEISEYGIYGEDGDSFRILDNTLTDSGMRFKDSTIEEIRLKDTHVTKVNTDVLNYELDSTSKMVDLWFVDINVQDEDKDPVYGATVLVYDDFDNLISSHVTDMDGNVVDVPLIEKTQYADSATLYNPYHVVVLKDTYKSTASLITVDEDSQLAVSLEKQSTIRVSTPSTESPLPMLFVFGFIGILGGLGASALFVEAMKFGLLSLFLPLYSRIHKGNVLDQPTRYKILGYIIGNPGAHFGLIKHDLELGNGQLADHIKHLTNAHLIYSKEDGIKKRFYPVGYPKKEEGGHPFSALQEKILGIVKSNRGISQKKLAKEIGISRQVAGYHLTKMEKEGVIQKKIIGRESRYYPIN
jgi:parallel beta-helix repeat protein